jgi:RNAse (barnase) inhibitor barstar
MASYLLFEKVGEGIRELKPEYILDGRRTTTLEAFYIEVGQVLLAGQPWDKDLDGLHAVLRGDYGCLPEAFRLVWQEVDYARVALGYDETIRQLLQQLRDCPPTALIKTAWALRAALREKGPTVFDWLVEAINRYPNIELVLVEATDASEQPLT